MFNSAESRPSTPSDGTNDQKHRPETTPTLHLPNNLRRRDPCFVNDPVPSHHLQGAPTTRNNRIRVEPVLLQSPNLQTVLLPGQEIELRPHAGNLPDGEYAIEPSMNCKESSNALTWLQPNILEVKGPPSTEFFGRVSSGLPKLSPSNTGGGSRKDPSMLRHLRFQQRPKRKRNTNPPHRLTYGGKFKQTISKHQSKDTSSEEES